MKEHIVAKYIKLYFNNTITECVADAIQISKLFLLGDDLSLAYALYIF